MSFIAKFQAQPSCKDMVAPEKNQLHINYNALLAVRYKRAFSCEIQGND